MKVLNFGSVNIDFTYRVPHFAADNWIVLQNEIHCMNEILSLSCTVVFISTGVLTIPEAFAGFSNSTVIMIASMFAVSAALQKTSIPYRMSKLLDKYHV